MKQSPDDIQLPVDTGLTVSIENNMLVISVGVNVLATAAEIGLCEFQGIPGKVVDPLTFAKDVIKELTTEEEDGTTLIHRLLDDAAYRALESGTEGWEDDVILL